MGSVCVKMVNGWKMKTKLQMAKKSAITFDFASYQLPYKSGLAERENCLSKWDLYY